MNVFELEDQVLSIEQINRLNELGFDTQRYSSCKWSHDVWYTDKGDICDLQYRVHNEHDFDPHTVRDSVVPTMTVGDILNYFDTEGYRWILEQRYIGAEEGMQKVLTVYKHRTSDKQSVSVSGGAMIDLLYYALESIFTKKKIQEERKEMVAEIKKEQRKWTRKHSTDTRTNI